MAKGKSNRYKVKEHKYENGTVYWRLSGYRPNGKQFRRNFPSQADAITERQELEKEDLEPSNRRSAKLTSLTDDQIRDAELAFSKAGNRKLSALVTEQLHWREVLAGRNINTVIAQYSVVMEIAKAQGFSILDAVKYYAKHFKNPIKSILLQDALERFIEEKSFSNEKTRENYINSIRVITATYPEVHVHELSLEHLDATLGKKSKGSQKSHRGRISSFLNWAGNRNYCEGNVCKRLLKIAEVRGISAYLRLEEVKRMLRAAMEIKGGTMVPIVALGLFAGLRPSEIKDLNPSDIEDNQISVTGGKMRHRADRKVTIPPALAAWLDLYPFEGYPQLSRKDLEKLKQVTNAEKWGKNLQRHTAISYHYATHGNKFESANFFGTSVNMINRHYLNTGINKAEAEAYWQLSPDRINETTIDVTGLKAQKRVAYPDDERLSRMLQSTPMTTIAKQLGCSDNAIRKHCKKRGFSLG